MNLLASLISEPDLLEVDHVDVLASCDRAFEVARRCDLGQTPLMRSLFAVRTLPTRLRRGGFGKRTLTIDDIVSSDRPGFRLLAESNREVVVGAIGQVWKLDIPFIEVRNAEEFIRFAEPGYAKVAWALRAVPRASHGARLEVELRVSATDDSALMHFRRYFRWIGPGSHFIRRQVLALLARELGSPESTEDERTLPGDDLLPDSAGQVTQAISIQATPKGIWPWLVQMGCQRAGWYSYDFLDNAGIPSAKEIHADLQEIQVGDVLPASPEGNDGFEVLYLEPPRTLILGGLFDPEAKTQLAFAGERPRRYWHVTWAFVLEAIDEASTRLLVRARVSFPSSQKWHASWIRPVHHFMQAAQLRNLKARAEGNLPVSGWHDVASGVVGAAGVALNLMTPFLSKARSYWGLSEEAANRDYPGDDLVLEPRWGWTHGIVVDAAPERVWPWVAQIGADRAGFYSYQWLENVFGCQIRNAETLNPEWEVRLDDGLRLHPDMPAIPIVRLESGHFFVAHATAAGTAEDDEGWGSISWLFFVEALSEPEPFHQPLSVRMLRRRRHASFLRTRGYRVGRIRHGSADAFRSEGTRRAVERQASREVSW